MDLPISVIVPVYNTEKYLQECVDSIIAQTIFECIEIILVDDGSVDNSPGICENYASRYKNIAIIHQNNAGVSAARNAGIEKASGRYIAFVDSDDYVFPEMYEKLYKNAEKTKADISVCGFVHCLPDGKTNVHYPLPENEALGREFIQENIYTFLLKEESFNTCCNKLFKKAVIELANIRFQVGRKNAEDRRFTVEFLSKSDIVCYTSYEGYYYRLVPTSATQIPRTDYLTNFISQYYENFAVFEALGVQRKKIEEYSGQKLLQQTITGIYFSENKLKGWDRRRVTESFINNDEIRRCLCMNWESLLIQCSTYKKLLFLMIRVKSMFGLRMVMLAMKTKNSLMRCKTR